MRSVRWVLIVGAAVVWLSRPIETNTPIFYDDDPIASVPDTQDASGVTERDLSLTLDAVVNLFGRPGDRVVGRAESVNTVDEVPDSSWYTNRAAVTPDEMLRGPNDDRGPAAGKLSVFRKSDGVSAGFTIADGRGKRYFVKFDAPGYPELGTGAEAVVTRLFHALGYHVPQANIVDIRSEDLVIGSDATVREPGGGRRPMRTSDIEAQLRRAERNADGSYRAVVTEALPGTPLGGFKYEGTRPDDPNDIVPHERRRELRGLRVFSAWVNHTDAKAINSLDTLIRNGEYAHVRHHLIDFNATLGSAGIGPRDRRDGYEYLSEFGPAFRAMPRFGFDVRPWMRIEYPELRGIGRFEAQRFIPEEWRPRVPNPAYVRSRPDDTFWAAMKLMGLSEDAIRAAVKAGKYADPAAEQFLVDALLERRARIARTWLVGVNPIIEPALAADGLLTFRNAAVLHAGTPRPDRYRATWYRFDNATGQAEAIGTTESASEEIRTPAALPASPDAFVRVDVSIEGGAHTSWTRPVRAHFRRAGEGWKLVAFERLPDAPPMRPGLVGAEPLEEKTARK